MYIDSIKYFIYSKLEQKPKNKGIHEQNKIYRIAT